MLDLSPAWTWALTACALGRFAPGCRAPLDTGRVPPLAWRLTSLLCWWVLGYWPGRSEAFARSQASSTLPLPQSLWDIQFAGCLLPAAARVLMVTHWPSGRSEAAPEVRLWNSLGRLGKPNWFSQGFSLWSCLLPCYCNCGPVEIRRNYPFWGVWAE